MAEFKLGRIKFVYQGAWQPSTQYVVDDVVTNGGKTYICVQTNTSSSLFATDLAGGAGVTKWNLIADGLQWRGAWTNSTLYNLGDIVQYGGTVYECSTSHTSAATTVTITATGLTVSGGTATLTYATQANGAPYVPGETITLAGFSPADTSTVVNSVNSTFTVLTCTTTQLTFALTGTYTVATLGTVSAQGGLETNQNDWTLVSENINWSGAWATSTRYKLEDLVYYGGVSYICNTPHVSASTSSAGLENDQSKWTVFNAGLNYLGAWGTGTRYKLNDIVKYGADIWICTTPHTSSGTTISTSNFSIFVNGLEFENSWSSLTNYVIGDLVTYGGYTYTAIQDNIGNIPSTSPSNWQIFTTGLVFAGAWSNSGSYEIGQVVTLGGFSYVALADNTASQPASGNANWGQLNPGIRWNSAPNTTYSNVASINVLSLSGSGTATFDVTLSGTSYSISVHPGAGGSGYAVGDTLKILGTNLGGISPVNDLNFKVATVTSGVISTVTIVTGYAVTWQTGMTYLVGDAVYYGNSSYICVSSHVGSAGTNDPISDTSASYWNLLASGADSGALTTTGDMVYYGSNGATRLPIGSDGQVLRVNGNIPSWEYYGLLQGVVYVAPNGVDVVGNSQGLSLDKPWATLLFACKQIEEGYLNINASKLLKINKQFMIKETNNFLLTNYSYNITGTGTGNVLIVGGSSTSSQTTTSSMFVGMPISFTTAITSQIVPGTTYYVNTIPSSSTFTISTSYKSGSAQSLSSGSSTTGTASLVYVQSKAERDAGTLIDAVIFDLSHGGNLYCSTAAEAFFSTLTSLITTNATYEVTAWVGSLNYLNSLILNVLSNTTPISYQALQGIPYALQAIQNISEVPTSSVESGAISIAQALLNIPINALSAGTYANLPQLQRPHCSIYLKTGTYNEYGPIVVPQDTAILGDELRSTIVQVASAQPYLANDRTRTISALKRIKYILPAIASNVPVTPVSTNTSTQQYIGANPYSAITSTISSLSTLIQNILANGLSALPGAGTTTISYSGGSVTVPNVGTYTLTTPTGFGSSLTNIAYAVSGNVNGATTNYDKAVANIQANISFIQTEIAAYMSANYNSVWTGMSSTNQGYTLRDVAYLLNSMIYDMTYGGNTQCQIDGLAYYSLGNSNIQSGFQAATTGMITRIQSIISHIVNGDNSGWTKTSGNTASQTVVTSGTYTSAAAYATALVTGVLNWVNGTNGTGNSLSSNPTGTVQPCYSWVSASLSAAFTNVQSNKTAIQTWIKNWVASTASGIVSNLNLTYRDAGTIVDALSYDLLLGSTYYSTVAGRSFYRLVTSAENLVGSSELTVTQNAISYITVQVDGYANGSSTGASGSTLNPGLPLTVGSIISNTSLIQTILAGGLTAVPGYGTTTITYGSGSTVTVPNVGTYTLTTPTGFGSTLTNTAYACSGNATGATTGYDKAVANISANIGFIQTEIAAYMVANYSSVWSGMSATLQGQTLRDVAYLLNSMIYDMTYGGNTQCQIDGLAYYSLGTSSILSTYQASTNAMLTRIQTIIPYIINGAQSGSGWTKTSGNNATQTSVTTGTYTNAGTYAAALVGTVITVFASGANSNTNSQSEGSITGSTVVYPCMSWQSASVLTAFNAIQAQKSYIQAQIQNYVATEYPNVVANLALTYRDAGTIVDALSYDMLLGSTYFSMVSGRAFYRLVTSAENLVGSAELGATQTTINYISYYISALATQAGQYASPAGDFGNPAAVNLVINNTAIIQNMMSGGLTITPGVLSNSNYGTGIGLALQPAISMPQVANYNTTYLVGYGYGVQQIQQNYQFIKDEIITYLNSNLSGTTWASYGPTYQAETVRDLSNILDAICYDMTYGCNDQSLIAGRAFYSLNSALIVSPYTTGVQLALARLSAIISTIVTAGSVTATSGNPSTQVTSGTAGSAAAGLFAVARVADIVYWLTNGNQNPTAGVATATFSGTTMTVSSIASGTLAVGQLVTGATLTTTVTAVNGSTGVVTLASTTGLASGMAITFSCNYGYGNQLPFGGLTTTTYTINAVSGSTVTLYNYGTTTSPALTTATGVMTAVAGVAPGTYITSIGSTAGSGGIGAYTVSVSQTIVAATTVSGTFTITPVISGAFSFATYNNQLSFNAIQAQATLIQNDAQAWVTRFFQNEGPSLTLTNRDAGYVVTALSYDVLFGGNFYSIVNGRAYNRLIASINRLQTNYADSVYGSIGFIGQKIKTIAAAGSVVQTQTTIDDLVAQIYGQPTNNCVFNGTVNGTQLTVNSITSGSIINGMQLTGIGVTTGTATVSGATTSITVTGITSTTGVFSCSGLVTPLVVGQTVTISGTNTGTGTINGTANGTGIYYVIGNPTLTAFQLSATQGGTNIASTTGTPVGLTFTGSPTTWLLNYSQSVSSTTTSIQNIIPTSNLITMGTTAGMVPGLQITITGTAIGNLTAGTYYIKQVLSSTQLTLSQAYNGGVFAVTPSNTLSSVSISGINGQFTFSAVSTALSAGQPVTISGTSSGSGSIVGYSNPTTYYIIGTPTATSFVLSATINGSPITTTIGTTTGLSFNVGSQGAMVATVYGIYSGLGLTTSLTGSSTNIPVTSVATSTNLITVNSNQGMYVNMPIVFSGLPSPITTTAIATVGSTTNKITLAASAASLGIVAGQEIYFTGVMIGTIVANQTYYVINPSGNTIQISNTLGGSAVSLTSSTQISGVTITSTTGVFACTALSTAPAVGQAITISGTLSTGTINGSSTVNQTFFVIGSPTTSAFQLSATLGGQPIVTTTTGTTITGTVFALNAAMGVNVNAAGGLVNGTQYWINSVTQGTYPNAGTTITVSNSYKSNTAFTITNSVSGMTAYAQVGVPTTQGYIPKMVTGMSQVWGNPTNSYQSYPGYNNTLLTIAGGELFRLNKTFLSNEAAYWAQYLYGSTVTGTASNGTITTSTPHNLLVGDPVQFGLTGTVFDSALSASTVYWVLSTPTSTTFTVSTTQPGTGAQSTLTLTGGSGTMGVNYYIIISKASRDAGYSIDALVYDIGLTGNYKSTRFTQVYLSAQSGSQYTDLFHVRNGTGIRNMTLNGMLGSLGLPNSYGTRRPTGGSYSSLDPGFGPNDSSTWAFIRSCYIQNVTTFGNGCVGMKIDAALHNGGNKSMLANDYTQVLSDGIGVYATGHGALTECVSVFAYYNYAGYLAEYGARIRATNGNSSYGTYGVVAEGVDSYETPIYATINNRANPAYITNVVTDATNYIFRIEYENAGSAYTNYQPTISGAGYNAVAIGDEFRDAAVFETRLVDLNNGLGVGGSNYLTISNTAQSGGIGYITIANSDTNLSTAYIGMRVQLTGGTGVGQYGNILNYTASSKIVNVYRNNFTPLTITTNSTSVFTVSSTGTMYVGQPIYLGAAIGGLSFATVYYVQAIPSSTTFAIALTSGGTAQSLTATSSTPAVMNSSTIVGTTLTVGTLASGTIYVGMLVTGSGVASNTYISANISGSSSGSTWTVTVSQNLNSTNLTGTISVNVYEAGWDHVVPGYLSATNTLDATTTYIIEPLLTYSSPGFTSTAKTLPSTATWGKVAYGAGNFVAVASGGTATGYSTNGSTWTAGGALPSSTAWTNVVYGGGQGATATATVGGLGGSGCILQAVLGTGSTYGQVVGINIIAGGNNYTTPPQIVITDSTGLGAQAVAEVLNGVVTAVYMNITGSLYTSPTVTAVTSEITAVTAVTWGQNYDTTPTVTITAPVSATAWSSVGSATSGSYYYYVDTTVSPNVTNYYQAGASGTFSTTAPTFTNAYYGKSSPTGTGVGPASTYGVLLTYIGSLPIVTANLTNNGVSSFTIVQAGYGYSTTPTVTITDPNAAFVAISSSSNAQAYNLPTTLGSAWTSNTNTTGQTTLKSLAYGNNYYIAVGGSGSAVAVSMYNATGPSTSWINQTSSITPNSAGYSQIAFGGGVFCAIGGTITSFMAANPTTWFAGGTVVANSTFVLTGVTITGTAGQFQCTAVPSATPLVVGQTVTISGTRGGTGSITGYSNPTTYKISVTNGSTTFTLTTTGGSAIVTTAGTPTGLTYTAGVTNKTWAGLAYGNGRFVALASDGTLEYTVNWQQSNWTTSSGNLTNNTWATVNNNPLYASGITTWSSISYGEGLFIATATSSQAVATSWDGLNWTFYATGMPSSSNWNSVVFGNPQNATLGAVPTWVAISNTSGTVGALIQTGPTALGRAKVVSSAISEIRMIEPGSGYPRGNVTATTVSTNVITVDSTVNLQSGMQVVFNGTSTGGITTGIYYYIVSGSITSTSFQISTSATGLALSLTTTNVSGMTYYASPIVTITDPNHVNTVPTTPRIGNGALGNPTFTNRGVGNTTATTTMSGDGYGDFYQTGSYINVAGLYQLPAAGCNITFSTIPNTWYKLVQVTNQLGVAGNYTATFQINPSMSVLLASPHGTQLTTRLLYSNSRLTGHDFLYIGTGGFTSTNYPNVDPSKAVQANQTLGAGGGRVFFTSTDQDGNFNVGNLFGVQQSTGTASLNASAFNLSGLQSLTLGSVSLGVNSATITQFSTDPYFTANSDNIVPTQKAIKAYITSQIGGGQSQLNVNTITSGQIYIAGNQISNTTGNEIYVASKMLFTGGIDGSPVALSFFGQK